METRGLKTRGAMMKTQTTATGAEWVVVAWDGADGIAGAQVVQEFAAQRQAEDYVDRQQVSGDPGLVHLTMRADEARAMGIE